MPMRVGKVDDYTLKVWFIGFDPEYVKLLKTIKGSRWKSEEKVWTLPYTLHNVERLIDGLGIEKLQAESDLLEECYLLQPENGKPALRKRRFTEEGDR